MPFWLIQGVFALQHCLDDVLVTCAVERRVAAEENVEDYTATPQIAHVIVAFLQHFWGYVIRCSVLLIHFLASFVHTRCAKVNYGDSRVFAVFI